jgi:hypothetical protein
VTTPVLPGRVRLVVGTWLLTAVLLPLAGFLPLVWVLTHGNPDAANRSGELVLGVFGFLSLPFGLVFGGLMAFVALMLRGRRPWARVVALVVAALALLLVLGSLPFLGKHVLAAMFFLPGPYLVALAGLITIPGLFRPLPQA